ncbi:MAG: 4Fe-4S binding protein [Candidatus Aenigmarchaeota archaeon]|nr:4Fe-4S binding protein [Candidatus Aenigmarchaeota archaeon]
MSVLVNNSKCVKCAGCVSVCPKDALALKSEIVCDEKKCINCEICITFCPAGALRIKK